MRFYVKHSAKTDTATVDVNNSKQRYQADIEMLFLVIFLSPFIFGLLLKLFGSIHLLIVLFTVSIVIDVTAFIIYIVFFSKYSPIQMIRLKSMLVDFSRTAGLTTNHEKALWEIHNDHGAYIKYIRDGSKSSDIDNYSATLGDQLTAHLNKYSSELWVLKDVIATPTDITFSYAHKALERIVEEFND